MSDKSVNICTWIYGDSKGEESYYPQVGGVSSSAQFQAVYWRCVIVFFASSIRNNPKSNHILFTNFNEFPSLGNFKIKDFLDRHHIQVVNLPLTYKSPPDYFELWKNQFYLLDIIKYIGKKCKPADVFLILDSDCIWINTVDDIVTDIKKYGLINYDLDVARNYKISGLSRNDMQKIYEELDGKNMEEPPKYFGGEWLAASGRELDKISAEVELIWNISLKRFKENKLKFNEEAYLLSYIYHKLGYPVGKANSYIRRMWTRLLGYNDVNLRDFSLKVWHLPYEKRYGIRRLFHQAKNPNSHFWKVPLGQPFARCIGSYVGVPKRTPLKLTLDLFDAVTAKIRKSIG